MTTKLTLPLSCTNNDSELENGCMEVDLYGYCRVVVVDVFNGSGRLILVGMSLLGVFELPDSGSVAQNSQS